jgi:drug/metabolite transporter (DMT)-like permease
MTTIGTSSLRTSIAFKKNRMAALVALGLSLSFASMSVWIRMTGDSFSDFQQSYLRILCAAVFALIFFRRRLSKHLLSSISRHEWKIYIIRAMFGYILGVSLFTVAITNADLSVVTFISAVPTLGLVAYVMFREKPPLASIPFLLVAAIGVLLVAGASFNHIHFGVGEIAAIIATLGFDVSFVMSRLHDKSRNNFENTTILLLIGWIPVFIIALCLHEKVIPDSISIKSLIGLLLASVFNAVNLYAANYVFTNLKAYVAGNLLLLECVWASMFGLLLYGESLTVAVAIGGILIVTSAIAVNKLDKKVEEPLAVQ